MAHIAGAPAWVAAQLVRHAAAHIIPADTACAHVIQSGKVTANVLLLPLLLLQTQ